MEVRKILKTEQGLLDIITDWMYDWWGEDLHRTYEEVKHFTEHSAEDDRLPQTYGLFVEGELVGVYQFRLDDLFVRPDIYPWLANVYVAKEHRGKGYGKALNESVLQMGRDNLDCDELYLYTHHVGLYDKYGWEYVSQIDTVTSEPRMQLFYKLKLREEQP